MGAEEIQERIDELEIYLSAVQGEGEARYIQGLIYGLQRRLDELEKEEKDKLNE